MCQALRFGFGMGVVLIDTFQVCLKSLSNFHGKNLAAFRLIFVAKIRQHFASDVSQHAKRYSHQAFVMRIQQWGCPIFTVKIRQSFMFGVLWCTGKKIKKGTWRGTLIHDLEKRLRERKREDRSGGTRPPNLLNIALCGLASSCLHPYPFLLTPRRSYPCSQHPRSVCVHATNKETNQQTSKETNRRKAC